MKDKVWFTFKARIQAHKRLEWLDFHSQTLLVWYAFLSTVLCVLTIRYPHILGFNTDVMATVLSVALLGVSLAVTNRDFRGRAVAMCSNYLRLQNLYNVLVAEEAAGNPPTPAQISQYADLLAECENHSEVDDRIARVFASNLSSRHPTDFERTYAYCWLTLRLITTTALYALPLILGLKAWAIT